MKAFVKMLLKYLARGAPSYQIRVALLRHCGYLIGKDVYIGEDFIIIDRPSDRGTVCIGDRAAISPRVTLVVGSEPNFSLIRPYAPVKYGSIVIGHDAWIGTGAVIMPNVTIGQGVVVGANAVVTRNAEPYTIVGGVPARVIRTMPVPQVGNKDLYPHE